MGRRFLAFGHPIDFLQVAGAELPRARFVGPTVAVVLIDTERNPDASWIRPRPSGPDRLRPIDHRLIPGRVDEHEQVRARIRIDRPRLASLETRLRMEHQTLEPSL